jgi:hypothetical protein
MAMNCARLRAADASCRRRRCSRVRVLPAVAQPRLLVASNTAEDAAVFSLTDEIALVMRTDFFTPILDDPYDFGRIAVVDDQ